MNLPFTPDPDSLAAQAALAAQLDQLIAHIGLPTGYTRLVGPPTKDQVVYLWDSHRPDLSQPSLPLAHGPYTIYGDPDDYQLVAPTGKRIRHHGALLLKHD